MPVDTTTCCAETVNSAISLWTELEIVDEDDDLYTYHTMDTNSVRMMKKASSTSAAAPPCLKKSTIGNINNFNPVSLDPSLKWQEEAYWMSFRDAVRSFSDQHCVHRKEVTALVAAQQQERQQDQRDEDGMAMDVASLHAHLEDNENDNVDIDYEEEDDDLPPCLPRTVVTPTASIATNGSHGEMSVTSHASSARRPPSRVKSVEIHRRGSFGSTTHNNNDQVSSTTGRSIGGGAGPAKLGTTDDYTAVRRNLQELAVHRNHGNNGILSSPGIERRIPRGDWTVSESLAGPNAEELKGIRWRMKELAEQAAAIVKGDKDAELYIIGSVR